MKYLASDKIPAPAGHYSPAVQSDRLVFVSGQIPSCDKSADFECQARDALQKCSYILESAGCSFRNVVQCTAYIVGIDNWQMFNTVFAELFGDHRPARAVVPVPELHFGLKVEIQMIAALDD